MYAQKADDYKSTIDRIYDKIDREVVFNDLKPDNRNGYLQCSCPACGQRRAFIYEKGKVLKCNRINSCGYQATILQYVAGHSKPRGDRFKRAIGSLCQMAGIIGPDGNIPLPKDLVRQRQAPAKKTVKSVDAIVLRRLLTNSRGWFAESRLARRYLECRGIPVELAQKYDVGFAPYGKWPHYNDQGMLIRQWRPGRITFPIYQAGRVVNIYGRVAGDCPGRMRHDFFQGTKGVWNAQVLGTYQMVYLSEGVFDALSLIAAGHPNTAAISGCHEIPWNRVKAQILCFCLDPEAIGTKRWHRILTSAVVAGKKVAYLPKSVFNGCDDLNDLWRKERRIKINTTLFKPASTTS